MKALKHKNIGSLARAYWQPLVLAVLILLITFEAFAWISKMIDLGKVDRIIASAETTHSTGTTSTPSPQPAPAKPQTAPKSVKNIFKQVNATYQLTAIYMDQAVINGQPHKVGDRIGKAVLKEIGIFEIKIQEDGSDNLKTIPIFVGPPSSGSGGPPPSNMPPNMGSTAIRHSGSNIKRSMSSNRSSSPSGGTIRNSGGGGMGMRARFENMSETQRQQLRDKVRNMSPDQRRQFIQRMRNGG